MKSIKNILLFLFLFSTYWANAQTVDSVGSLANETVDLMINQRLQRMTDSIQVAALRLQIENTSELSRRIALEEELARMKREDSLRVESVKNKIIASKESAKGYPVLLGADTLFTIYTNNGSFSAEDRALNCNKKIKTIAGLYSAGRDSILVNCDNVSAEVLFEDKVILTVTIADALWEGVSQDSLANRYAEVIDRGILTYKEQTAFSTIVKQIGLSLLVVIAFYFLIRLLNRTFKNRLNLFIEGKKDKWFNGMKLKDFELLNSESQVKFVLFGARMVRYLITLLLLYIALPMLFSIYPITQKLADKLFNWVMSPLKGMVKGFLDYIPDMLTVAVICVVMHYVMKALQYFAGEIESGRLVISGFYPDWAKATYNIVRLLLYAFTFVMIFPYLPGSDSEIFKGVSVFIGVVFSLGSSSAIANMVAGMVITYMRPFKIGDHIKIGDLTGDVTEKTPFVIRMITAKKEVITIPNSTILSSSITNYSTSITQQGVIFHTTITIGYDVPWRKIHEMMIEAGLRTDFVLADPKPYVLQTSLDDFYVSYQLCVFSKNPEKQALIYSGLHTNIQDVFNENGVEIMSPHYRAQRDGNTTTTPSDYLPSDYVAPVFKVSEESKGNR